MDDSFDAFFTIRQDAAAHYGSGDGKPLDAIVPHAGDATFHSPGGDSVSGAAEVAARYQKDAGSFEPGGQSRFEVLQKYSDGNMAFWTGFQIARVRLKGKPEPIEMRIRITEVFRRLDGHWKMIHRHADMGAPKR